MMSPSVSGPKGRRVTGRSSASPPHTLAKMGRSSARDAISHATGEPVSRPGSHRSTNALRSSSHWASSTATTIGYSAARTSRALATASSSSSGWLAVGTSGLSPSLRKTGADPSRSAVRRGPPGTTLPIPSALTSPQRAPRRSASRKTADNSVDFPMPASPVTTSPPLCPVRITCRTRASAEDIASERPRSTTPFTAASQVSRLAFELMTDPIVRHGTSYASHAHRPPQGPRSCRCRPARRLPSWR